MKTHEERREEERRYNADVDYEVWRNGGDTDRIDYDRVRDNRDSGYCPEESAKVELNRQKPRPSEEELFDEGKGE